MFRRVLFPVDGSEFAEAAAAAAAGLAGLADAEIRLVLVHKPLPAVTEQSKAELIAWARKGEEAYLEEARRRLFGRFGSRVSLVLLKGDPAEQIAKAAAEWRAELVVMATHGRGYPGRLWLGSVADRLVRLLSIPLLLLRPKKGEPTPVLAVRRILVPLDQSETSERILGPARGLARMTDAELILFHAVHIPDVGPPAPGPVVYAPALTEELTGIAREYLEHEAERLRGEGFTVKAVVTQAVEVARAIADTAAAERADVIAMATQGATGIRRLLLGSVADRLLRTSQLPLLVAPPGEVLEQAPAAAARVETARAL